MTQPQTLNVEYQELMARANEVEAPIPGLPSDNPAAPWNLAVVKEAVEQLGFSADNMRLYLSVGERERRRLAQSLRNAAKAYQEADAGAQEALYNETPVSTVTPQRVDIDVDPATLKDTPVATTAGLDDYADLKQRCADIESGDQGASLVRFAEAWRAYQRSLRLAAVRFRPFETWNGEAAAAVEANFEQQRSWLNQMADHCGTMIRQAENVMSVHLHRTHIPYAYTPGPNSLGGFIPVARDTIKYQDLVLLERVYQRNVGPHIRPRVMDLYATLQQKSDEMIADYTRKAGLPLPPVNPSKPSTAFYISEPDRSTTPPPGSGPWSGPGLGPSPNPDLPLADGGLPFLPGMPGVPSDGTPSTTDAKLTEALKDLKGSRGRYPVAGLKPASFGGDGAGLPSTPLLPWGSSEGASGSGGARSAMQPGLRVPAAYAALGGGGMGMPMAPPAGTPNQTANKGKRAQLEDDALYTEDRAWTEPVIGRIRT